MELGTEPAPAWPEDEAQPERRLWRAARYRVPFGNEINENNSSERGWPPAFTYGKAPQVNMWRQVNSQNDHPHISPDAKAAEAKHQQADIPQLFRLQRSISALPASALESEPSAPPYTLSCSNQHAIGLFPGKLSCPERNHAPHEAHIRICASIKVYRFAVLSSEQLSA
ncbi:hypothetical protein STEG23_021036 [Scotinomys teguina]